MRTRFKSWAKPYLEEHASIALPSLESDANFFSHDFLHLEIGCGKGDFIIAMAKRFPHVHFLAVEVSAMVAAVATKKIVDEGIDNVRVMVENIDAIFPLFKEQMFDVIYLNFSDPWPKRRHEKRRLTFPSKLLEYERILKNDSYLYFKTDNTELYEYSLTTFLESPLEVISYTSNYDTLDESDACSEYEKIFRSEGKKINRIIARRKKDETN
ncbi:MAG: tRNA (guanosine(46)-N7)-methyltransferase TrmB [Bacilli bacterium]|jgi:tRNA (guanine-N7-)-methyltransferase